MPKYIVNRKAAPDGFRRVHITTCVNNVPKEKNQRELPNCLNDEEAVSAAKIFYDNAKPCCTCMPSVQND